MEHGRPQNISIKAAVLTISDRSSRGEREDRSGPAIRVPSGEKGVPSDEKGVLSGEDSVVEAGRILGKVTQCLGNIVMNSCAAVALLARQELCADSNAPTATRTRGTHSQRLYQAERSSARSRAQPLRLTVKFAYGRLPALLCIANGEDSR